MGILWAITKATPWSSTPSDSKSDRFPPSISTARRTLKPCTWWNVIGSSITKPRGKHGSVAAERISAAAPLMKDGLPTPTIRARDCNSNSPSKMRASSQQLGPRPKPIGASSVTGRNVSVPKTHIDTVPKKTLRSRLPSSLISDGTAQIITLWRNVGIGSNSPVALLNWHCQHGGRWGASDAMSFYQDQNRPLADQSGDAAEKSRGLSQSYRAGSRGSRARNRNRFRTQPAVLFIESRAHHRPRSFAETPGDGTTREP